MEARIRPTSDHCCALGIRRYLAPVSLERRRADVRSRDGQYVVGCVTHCLASCYMVHQKATPASRNLQNANVAENAGVHLSLLMTGQS